MSKNQSRDETFASERPSQRELFRKFSHKCSEILGSAGIFAVAILVIAIWALAGPVFHYSDAWQLLINTGTTIVTFLMVFIIQNTQNRDSKAIHLKLDELIRAHSGARDNLVSLEELSDRELLELEHEFRLIRERMTRRRQPSAASASANTGAFTEPVSR